MHISRKLLHQRAAYYLLVVICFGLPLLQHVKFNGMTALIILLTVNWLVEGQFKEKFEQLLKEKWIFVLVSCFFVYLVGVLYTADMNQARIDVQSKLPLLIFPVVLGTITYLDRRHKENIMYSFIAGCLLAIFIVLGYAIYADVYLHENYFLYPKLSIILHPVYFSIYLNLAIFATAYITYTKWETLSIALRVFASLLMLIFIIFIFLLLARIGMITLMLMILIVTLRFVFHSKHYLKGIASMVLFGGLFLFLFNEVPNTFNRLKTIHHELFLEGSAKKTGRLLLWNASWQVIKKYPIAGVGVGDVEAKLTEEYRNLNLKRAANKNLNPHNQFLHTTIALGIIGLTSLLAILLLPLYIAFKRKHYIQMVFILLCMIFFLSESIIELQMGVTFFAFFNSFLLFQYKD